MFGDTPVPVPRLRAVQDRSLPDAAIHTKASPVRSWPNSA